MPTAQQFHRDLGRRNPVDVTKLVARLPTGPVQGWSTHHHAMLLVQSTRLAQEHDPF